MVFFAGLVCGLAAALAWLTGMALHDAQQVKKRKETESDLG